jgi:chromosomal replication initiator protein
MELDQLWLQTCAVFRADVSDDVYDRWLSQLEPVRLAGDELLLTGPERARSWIDLRYSRSLTDCACKAAGREIAVSLISPSEAETPPVGGATSARRIEQGPACTPLNARYTFDQFVIGASNRLGHAAALAVAEQPAQAFNPLFLYGSPGVGKTHLLHAIGNYLRREAPEIRVTYMTAEDFASSFRSVIRDGSIAGFKSELRGSDVLLIDDIQFLQNKAKTEEEFFHTFNALHESGRQLVITCDRRPRELDALAERLLARFESGLVAEIDRPDEHLRKAILRKRVQLDNVPIDCEQAIDRIAERVPANVRSLEGALIRVSAFASLRREPVTAELVDELLDSIHPQSEPRVTVVGIQNAVAEHFGLTVEQLRSPSRESRLAAPRQMAMYLSCELTRDSLPTIAAAFERNHSTVIHARDKLAATCGSGGDLAATADTLRRVINTRSGGRAAA